MMQHIPIMDPIKEEVDDSSFENLFIPPKAQWRISYPNRIFLLPIQDEGVPDKKLYLGASAHC